MKKNDTFYSRKLARLSEEHTAITELSEEEREEELQTLRSDVQEVFRLFGELPQAAMLTILGEHTGAAEEELHLALEGIELSFTEGGSVSLRKQASKGVPRTTKVRDKRKRWSKHTRWKVALAAGIVLAIGAAAGVVFGLDPLLQERQAREALIGQGLASGTITIANSELLDFGEATLEGTNPEQKALGAIGEVTEPAAFVFTNGKAAADRKVVEVYLDFYNQTGRDFFLTNQALLKSLVETGVIELQVKPVPTDTPFSLYAPEALAEVAATEPGKAWDALIELLKQSIVIASDSNADVISSIAAAVEELGVIQVDSSSIRNGTFASWLLTVADDPRLAVGYYPPVIYIDGKELDPSSLNLNDPDAVRRTLIGF